MTLFQSYVFRQTLWPFLSAITALTGLAVLTQSLSNLSLIAERSETAIAFALITLLAMPQVIALLLPIAIFIGTAMALNRLIGDSEFNVVASAGMSRRQRISPIMRLAVYAMLANMAVNLFVQPASFRQMRQIAYEIRTDIAASLMREGEFIALGEHVTFYARSIRQGAMLEDVFIEDGRGQQASAYAARRGHVVRSGAGPVMLLEDGVITQTDQHGRLTNLSFERYEFDLSTFIDSSTAFFFKESDKFLPELLDPGPADIARARSARDLYAEGHYRLSSPLYTLAFALIAAAAFMAVEHRRTGYMRFLIMAGCAALVLRLAGYAVQAAASADSSLNIFQYLIPLAGMGAAMALIAWPRRKGAARKREAIT